MSKKPYITVRNDLNQIVFEVNEENVVYRSKENGEIKVKTSDDLAEAMEALIDWVNEGKTYKDSKTE